MNWKTAFVFVACAAALVAQTPPATILEIATENSVVYFQDVMDLSKWGTQPGPVPSDSNAVNRGFLKERQTVADIVAVNGKPAKGLLTLVFKNIIAALTSVPGRHIADLSGGCVREGRFILLHPDGTPIGMIAFSGSVVTGTPGGPSSAVSATDAVVGGTGPFLGARGQSGFVGAARWASGSEDPAYRRVNGGDKLKYYVQLIPMTWPEVLALPTGPAIFHAQDFSPVTADKPARAGEQLIVRATGLGPVRPSLDPGKPFPPYPEGILHEVNSPVDVTVNGKAAAVINKYGWPATTNVYRVDFVVPDGTAAGMATLGLSVAWINGPEVKIPVR